MAMKSIQRLITEKQKNNEKALCTAPVVLITKPLIFEDNTLTRDMKI